MDAMIAYLQAHPLVALGLALLAVLLFGSIFGRLLRLAFWLGLVLLVGLYFTHRSAEGEWRAKAEMLGEQGTELLKKVGEQVKKYGEEALEEGKKAVDKELSEQ